MEGVQHYWRSLPFSNVKDTRYCAEKLQILGITPSVVVVSLHSTENPPSADSPMATIVFALLATNSLTILERRSSPRGLTLG